MKNALFIFFAFLSFSWAADKPSLYQLLLNDPDYRIYAKALELAGFAEILKNDGAYTLFVPIDEALPELLPYFDEPEKLKALLSLHIVEGTALSQLELAEQTMLETLDGTTVTVSNDGIIRVNEAIVFGRDIPGSNGFSHFVDRVIMPLGQ